VKLTVHLSPEDLVGIIESHLRERGLVAAKVEFDVTIQRKDRPGEIDTAVFRGAKATCAEEPRR